jgi:serine/threonine protein kinase
VVNLFIFLGLNGVPQFIASNLNATNGIESNNDLWIITEYIEGDTLSDFIGKSSVELEDALIITFKLLNIVKQMHSRNIVHRNIRPENIIIRKQLNVENNQNLKCCDKISLVLTGFSFACIHQENDENNVHNNTAIFKDNQNQIWNNFYQVPQFETQSSTNGINKNQQRNFQCSSTIDTTLICAILFWLITKCYPRESRNIHEQAPHELIDHANLIDKELDRATGKKKEK